MPEASDSRRENIRFLAAYFDRQGPDPALEEFEVIDAFDVAGDDDAYVSLQERILDYGLRRFPDSESLLIRQAFMLHDGYETEKAMKIAGKVSEKLAMRQLFDALLLHDGGADDQAVYAALEQILQSHRELADEEMIRLLSIAMELEGGLDWLNARLDELRRHTTFPQVLFYELAHYAREENVELSERYIEELTLIDPFEIDFWSMLAEVHITLGKYVEAQQDIDYALAINPDSDRARLLNANLRLLRGDDINDVLAEINDLVFSEGPLDSFPLYVAITALDSQDQSEKGSALLTKYIEKFPENRGAIDLLVSRMGDSEQTRAALDRLVAASGSDVAAEQWEAWAADHFDHCDYQGTLVILEAAIRGGIRLNSHLTYIQSLYYTNQAARVVRYILENKLLTPSTADVDDYLPQSDGHIVTVVVMIMSLIRTGGEDFALRIIDEELSVIKVSMIQGQLMHNLGIYGFRETLRNIKKHMRLSTYPDSYDPLLMPQNIANTRRSRK